MRLPTSLAIMIPLAFFPLAAAQSAEQTLIVAGGCFWCVESDFDHIEGVKVTTSGYTGGDLENATYRNHGQHIEAVKIDFDPDVVSLEQLLVAYWHSVDPTDAGGQFCDRGHSYQTAVFVTPEQREAAESSKSIAQKELGSKKIVTPILDAKTFWDAEGYHQDYYMKNAARYNFYRFSCGRNARVDAVWGANSYKGINH